MQATATSATVACCSPQNSFNIAISLWLGNRNLRFFEKCRIPPLFSLWRRGLPGGSCRLEGGMFAGTHHVAVICSDYPRSKRFYTEVLGFKIVAETYREERRSYKLDLAIPGGVQIELFSFPILRPDQAGRRLAGCVIWLLLPMILMRMSPVYWRQASRWSPCGSTRSRGGSTHFSRTRTGCPWKSAKAFRFRPRRPCSGTQWAACGSMR